MGIHKGVIFNGYNADLMEKHCPFPLIQKYLKRNHGLFKDKKCSCSRNMDSIKFGINLIAKYAEISSVYDSLEHLLNGYSYILLTGDMQESYLNCSRALQRGSFVYVDKPIALSVDDLTRLYDNHCPIGTFLVALQCLLS